MATSGRPSGTAATVRATALPTASRSGVPRSVDRMPTAAPPARLHGSARLVMRASCRCRPIWRLLAGAIAIARCISVLRPTVVTTASAVPATIVVPA